MATIAEVTPDIHRVNIEVPLDPATLRSSSARTSGATSRVRSTPSSVSHPIGGY